MLATFASIAGTGAGSAASAAPAHSAAAAVSHVVQGRAIARTSTEANWPQLGFDAGHSADNPYETTIGPSNVAQLQQAWSFSTGTGNDAGNVIEASGVVYAPSANGMLYAINAATGSQLWSLSSGSGYASSGSAPAYDSGALFTVCTTSTSTQGICALNAASGVSLWTYTFPGSDAYDGTPPVVSGGLVLYEACATSCAYIALTGRGNSGAFACPT